MTLYHTVSIVALENGKYEVVALANGERFEDIVGSLGIGLGGTAAGIKLKEGESVEFEAAAGLLSVEIEDFRKEHGYREANITFHDRDELEEV